MFTLHTEPRVDPPEFTVTYCSQGGPVTAVQWIINDRFIDVNGNALNQSQLILDTSKNSVYANKLHIRGRKSWTYFCLSRAREGNLAVSTRKGCIRSTHCPLDKYGIACATSSYR